MQFTRSKDGLGGVLRKVADQQAHDGPGNPLHRSVQHMLLVDTADGGRWFDSHPPLAERIQRIYGRPMPSLPARNRDQPTRPDAIF